MVVGCFPKFGTWWGGEISKFQGGLQALGEGCFVRGVDRIWFRPSKLIKAID